MPSSKCGALAPQRAASSIAVDGRDVTPAFAPDAARGALTGVVTGLRVGREHDRGTSGRPHREARGDEPPCHRTGVLGSASGPVRLPDRGVGPRCATRRQLLGADEGRVLLPIECAAGTVRPAARARPHARRPSSRGPLQAPASTDIAQTTTSDGRSVPYIVRVESGTINRSIYRIAILDDPARRAPQAWRPGAGWNRRLMFSFGGGCGTNYDQGDQPGDRRAERRGAVARLCRSPSRRRTSWASTATTRCRAKRS